VAQAHDLAAVSRPRVGPAARPYVEEQLRQRIDVQRRCGVAVLGEALPAVSVHGGRRRIDQRDAVGLAPIQQPSPEAEVVLEDLEVGTEGIRAGAEMEHGAEARRERGKVALELLGRKEVLDAQRAPRPTRYLRDRALDDQELVGAHLVEAADE